MSMKKKNFWSAVLAMGLAATLSVGFVGCSDDDEPTPEIVENPLEKGGYISFGVFYRLKYVKASVEIVNYLGCTPRISYEYGASHPGHSGGAIQ